MDIYLAEPRGFCAGVRRAIFMVENALAQYGAPVYVRHEIVHNKHVIADLTAKGAVFIEELDEADSRRPVIFSAHGISQKVAEEAAARGLTTIDATCPLVEKFTGKSVAFKMKILKLSLSANKIILKLSGRSDRFLPKGKFTSFTRLKKPENWIFHRRPGSVS